MDPFVERIMERARERSKRIQEYENNTPLKESNLKATENQPKTSSEPNLTATKKENRKAVVSDSCLSVKTDKLNTPLKENTPEGSPRRFLRQNSNSTTRISSDSSCSPKCQNHSKTLNIQKDDFNMEIKLTSSDHVRVEVEFTEEDSDEKSGHSGSEENAGACLREDAKNRLKRLGKLYAGGEEADISSPIHRAEPKFDEECSKKAELALKKIEETSTNNNLRKGLKCLSNLAETINQWEDEINPRKDTTSNKTSPTKVSKWSQQKRDASSPQKEIIKPPVQVLKPTIVETKPKEVAKETPKQLSLDKAVLDTLESQGFTRTTSNTRLIYKYQTPQEQQLLNSPQPMSPITEEPKRLKPSLAPNSPSKLAHRGPSIASKAALFESPTASPSKNAKDPALLSVAERKALFEKNKGAALVPKAAFGMAVPPSAVSAKGDDVRARQKPRAPPPPVVSPVVNKGVVASAREGIASVVSTLFEGKATIGQEQIESSVRAERRKEMDVLLNRFKRNKETVAPSAPPAETEEDEELDTTEATPMIKDDEKIKIVPKTPTAKPPPKPSASSERRGSSSKRCSAEDSPKVAASLENVKRIRVSPQKPGRLYPCLSDIEATTETEPEVEREEADSSPDTSLTDSDRGNTSFGREILQAVCKNDERGSQKRAIYDDSTASDVSSDVLDGADDYLDEAIGYNASDSSSGPTPPKLSRKTAIGDRAAKASHSFSYKSFGEDKTPDKVVELPTHVVDGENVVPLTHTVSFYRKQQTQISTPVRQVTRQPAAIIEERDDEVTNEDVAVQLKIDELQDEVNKQQMVIAQTSQALNLCNSTPEFMGSTEQVEAERLLLVATHRRTAALNEMQRLKVEGTLHPQSPHTQTVPLERGALTLSEISLPLKREYVRVLCAAGGKGHHVVCLVKSGEQVIPTRLVSTVASNAKDPDVSLTIPGLVTLNNVYSNSTVTFEVYCLQAQEEILPHEVKYHIGGKKGYVTPKKSKQESRMVRPLKESPGGPQVVRSPSFALMGYVVFSIQAVNRRNWCLNKVPSLSPLEGSVEMKITCELAVSVEHRGFLTTFEDISGFGAWHRRWYLLKGHLLSYWKYPDDEKKMPPIDTIDLKNCVTDEVKLVSRDICARPHTILVEREREASPQDKDSLTMVCKGNTTVIRHLLSADTKEDRVEWCAKLNAALIAFRMWGNQQQ